MLERMATLNNSELVFSQGSALSRSYSVYERMGPILRTHNNHNHNHDHFCKDSNIGSPLRSCTVGTELDLTLQHPNHHNQCDLFRTGHQQPQPYQTYPPTRRTCPIEVSTYLSLSDSSTYGLLELLSSALSEHDQKYANTSMPALRRLLW
jgi:hypothetical protein